MGGHIPKEQFTVKSVFTQPYLPPVYDDVLMQSWKLGAHFLWTYFICEVSKSAWIKSNILAQYVIRFKNLFKTGFI